MIGRPSGEVARSTEREVAGFRRGAVFWGCFLLALTSWPSPPSVPVLSRIPSFDKLVHATLYGVEAFLLYGAVRWPGKRGYSVLRALSIVGFLAVFGTLDETHQWFIPGRSMEAMDAVGDTTGAAIGALAGAWWAGRRARAGRSAGST